MGLRDRSATGWVSAQRENLSRHSQSKRPWRSILKRLSNRFTSALLPPLLLQVSFLWPRRTEACGPVSITGHWTSPWCHYLHQAGPPQRVQPHPNTWGGQVEDCLRDPYWPQRIFGYAVWPSQRPLRISGLHARGAPRVPSSLRLGIHRWYPHLLSEPGRISPPHCGGPSMSAAAPTLPQSWEMLVHPYNSWVIILTVVAFGWTRGRWRPLRPGHNHQRTPTLPGILQLLPPLHTELQYPYQSTHELTPQQAQVSVLVYSHQWSFREVKDVFHTSSHPRSSWSRETLHCGSRCFHHGCGSHPFPAAGESI